MVDKADMVDVFRNIFSLVFAFLIYLIVPAVLLLLFHLSSNPVSEVVAAYRAHQTFQKDYQLYLTFQKYKGLIDKNPIT